MEKLTKQLKKAFTLIELVVVIAVIAILSGVSVVSYVGITKNAKQRACETEAAQLKTLLISENINNYYFTIEGNTIKFSEGYSWVQLKEALATEDSEFANLLKNTSVSEDGLKLVYTLDKSSTVLFQFEEKEDDVPLTEESLAILKAQNAWNEMKQSYASFVSENGDKNNWFYDYISDVAIYEGNEKYLVTYDGKDFNVKTNDGSTKKEWGAITESSVDFVNFETLDNAPYGLKLSYYSDIYSRGFSWTTSNSITDSELYVVESNKGIDADFPSTSLQKNGSHIQKESVTTHKAYIENLKPATTYSYKVGSESGWKYGIFRTDAEKPLDFTAVELTDAQTKDPSLLYKWENTFAQSIETVGRKIDTILYCGDQFDTSDSFKMPSDRRIRYSVAIETVSDYLGSIPYMAVSGNHEPNKESNNNVFVDSNAINFVDNTLGNYSYDYDKIHFTMLNWREIEKQVDWLKNDLSNAKINGSKWIIVSIHNGPYATGDHSNDNTTKNIITKLTPIFSQYHVDLVLQGHDHTYNKTLPYKWDAAGYTTTKNNNDVVNFNVEKNTVNNISYDLNPNGTYYVTTGAAGHRFGQSEGDAGIWAELNAENQPLLENVGFTYNDYKIEVGKIGRSNSYNPFTVNDTKISQASTLGSKVDTEKKYSYTSPQIYTANVSDASAHVNANMFGILNIKDNTLRYDFYTVVGNEVKLFDSLNIMKTSN